MKSDDIKRIEEMFINLGAERMSKYFGMEDFGCGLSSYHVLWVSGKCYFGIDTEEIDGNTFAVVTYNETFDEPFELFGKFPLSDNDEVMMESVKNIFYGISPDQMKILKKYVAYRAL